MVRVVEGVRGDTAWDRVNTVRPKIEILMVQLPAVFQIDRTHACAVASRDLAWGRNADTLRRFAFVALARCNIGRRLRWRRRGQGTRLRKLNDAQLVEFVRHNRRVSPFRKIDDVIEIEVGKLLSASLLTLLAFGVQRLLRPRKQAADPGSWNAQFAERLLENANVTGFQGGELTIPEAKTAALPELHGNLV